MANNNEFIIDVGARLNDADLHKLANEIKTEANKLSKLHKITLKANIDTKEAYDKITKLKNILKNDYNNKVRIGIDDGSIKMLTNFEKRLGILKNKINHSGLDEMTSDFKSLQAALKDVSIELNHMVQINDFSGIESLHQTLNGVEAKYDELIRTQRQEQIELSKENSAAKTYEQELNKLIQLEVKLTKIKNISKNKNSGYDISKLGAIISSLEAEIAARKKAVEIARQEVVATGGSEKATKIYEQALRKLKIAIDGVNLEHKEQLGLLQNIKNGFRDAIQNVSSYTLAFSTIQFAVQQLRQSIDTIIELDKVMVDLQIVTNSTRQEIHDLMQDYNQMAIDMGRSTKTVATSANEFLRMGYNAKEANELIKQSLTLSTLGMIDAAEATDYMISAMKGYGIEVKDVSKVIDMATELDMKYSISSGYIMEAMSRTAASAKLAGSEMSNLMAMISIVGETTKKAPEVVGEAMKTMYARFGNVKINKFEDAENPDEVEGINDIERVLNNLGIAIRTAGGEWRNYDDVMAEVGSRFNELTDLEQNAIATAMFGTRQRENGIVILTNWNRVLEANQIALTSAGTSEERMAYYTEGLGAAIERVGAAWERFLISLGDNQDIINIVNFVADIVELLSNPVVQKILLTALLATSISKITAAGSDLISKLGAMKGGLLTFVNAMKLGNTTTTALTKGLSQYAIGMGNAGLVTKEAAQSMIAGSAAGAKYLVLLGKLAIAAVALYAAYKIFDYFNVSYEEHKEKLEEVSAEYEKALDDIENVNQELKTVGKRLDELNKKDNPTLVEKEEIKKLEATNTELKKELEYLEAIERQKNKEKYKEAASLWTDEYESETMAQQPVLWSDITDQWWGGYKRKAMTLGESEIEGYHLAGMYNDQERIKGYIESYKKLMEQYKSQDERYKDAVIKASYGWLPEDFPETVKKERDIIKQQLDATEQYLEEHRTKLEESFGDFEYIPNPTTDDEKNVNEAIELLQLLQDFWTETFNPDGMLYGSSETIDGLSSVTANATDIIKEFVKTCVSTAEKLDILETAQSELSETGGITADTLQSLTDNDLLPYLDAVNGKLVVNISDFKKDAEEKRKNALDTLNNAAANDILALAEGNVNSMSSIAQEAIKKFGEDVEDAGDKSGKSSIEVYTLATAIDAAMQAAQGKGINLNVEDFKKQATEIWNAFDPLRQLIINADYETGSGSGNTDKHLEAFEKWYNNLKHMLNMDEITEKEYYDRLEQKNLEYFANKKKYQEEYDKYEEEVYKGRKSLWKEAFDDELDELKKQLDRKIINEEQYLKAYKELNDRYFKDNPVFKDEYDKGEAELYNLGVERIENEYDRWISLHEDHIEDMDYYNKWSLQQKLNYIAQEMSAMEKLYGNNEILAEEFAKTQKELQKQLYDTSKELAQQNLDTHDAYLEYVNNIIDKEVEALEEKKEALEEENDERKQAIELAELEEKLASAKRNKVLIYRKGQGFVYEQDQTAVNAAQKELDEYLYEREKEKRIDAIQDEIDAWEDYRDEWNRTVDAYNEEQTRLTALMYEGYASEKDILKRRTDLIDNYAESYAKAAQKVAEASQLINSGIYDFEYDPDTGEFTTSSKGDYYTGGNGIGDLYSETQRIRDQYIKNSGETWAILPSGQYVKVNVNDKNKVTDSIPVGSTVVNASGAWTVTGGTAGAYEAVEVKKTNSYSGGGGSGGGGSKNTSSDKGYYGETKDSNGKTNQQKYLEGLVSKGSSSGASDTDKGKAEWAKQELAAGKYAKGTTGTLSDEIAEVGEEGRELRILPKGTGIVPNPATETLMKFADNPAAFINSLSLPVMSSAVGGEHTEVFNISGITVNANNAEEFIKSLKGLKNKAIQKASKRN